MGTYEIDDKAAIRVAAGRAREIGSAIGRWGLAKDSR